MNSNSGNNKYNTQKKEYNDWNSKQNNKYNHTNSRRYNDDYDVKYQSNRYEPYHTNKHNYDSYHQQKNYNYNHGNRYSQYDDKQNEWNEKKIVDVYDKVQKSKEVTNLSNIDNTNITNSRTIHQKEVETTIINNSHINPNPTPIINNDIQKEINKSILKKNVTFTENKIHHYETDKPLKNENEADIENEEEIIKKNTKMNSKPKIQKNDEIKNQQFMKTLEELTNRLKGCNYNVGVFHNEYDKKIDELLTEINKYLEFRGKNPLKIEDDRKWMTTMFEQKLINFKTEITKDLQIKHFESINHMNQNMNQTITQTINHIGQTNKFIENSNKFFNNHINDIEKNQKEMIENIKKDSLTQTKILELSKKEFLNQNQKHEKLLKTNDNSLKEIKTLIKETKDEIMSEKDDTKDDTKDELLKKNNDYIAKVIRTLKTSMDKNISDTKETIKEFINDFKNTLKNNLKEQENNLNLQVTNSLKELQNNNVNNNNLNTNIINIVENTITSLFEKYIEDNESDKNENIQSTGPEITVDNTIIEETEIDNNEETDNEVETPLNTNITLDIPDYIVTLFNKIDDFLNSNYHKSGDITTGFENKLNNSYKYNYHVTPFHIIIKHNNKYDFNMIMNKDEIKLNNIVFIKRTIGKLASSCPPPNLPLFMHQKYERKNQNDFKKVVNRISIILDTIKKNI
jgi:hypothetical protein